MNQNSPNATDKSWMRIAIGLILALNISFALYARVKDVDRLQGKYLLGYDSYFYLRQAKTVIDRGRLPARDYMQHYPEGLDLRQRANLNCYAIAYFYKLVRFFRPNISIEQSTIYYPLFCFILLLLMFFMLARMFLSTSAALFAVTFFVALPGDFVRTYAGWADRDGLSLLEWLMSVFFYVAAHKSTAEGGKRYLLLAALSGVSTGLLGLTWPGVGSLSVIIVLFSGVKLLTRNFSHREFYMYLCWYVPSTAMMLAFTKRYASFDSTYALSAIVLPTLFVMLVISDILIRQVKSSATQKILYNFLFASLVVLSFIGPVPPERVIFTFLNPAGTEALIRYIGEFRPTHLFTWFEWYLLFVILPPLGVCLAIHKLLKAYRLPARLLIAIFAVTFTTTLLSSVVLPIAPSLVTRAYVGFVMLFFGMVFLSYCSQSAKVDTHKDRETDRLLFFAIWMLCALFYTRGAMRFAIFLFPVAILFGVYAVTFILQRLFGPDEDRILNFTLLVVFMALCWELRFLNYHLFLGIGFNDVISFLICWGLSLIAVIFLLFQGFKELPHKQKPVIAGAKWVVFSIAICAVVGGVPYLVPHYFARTGQLPMITLHHVDAFNFIKGNTDEDSVIAAWWNEGSRIEALAERATIIDQQPNYPLIYDMAGKVFCAETVDTALGFLQSRKATHFLMMPSDAFRSAISEVASTQGTDQTIEIKIFEIDEKKTQAQRETRPQVPDAKTEKYRSSSNKESESVTVEYNLGRFHKATVSLGDISISPKYILFDNERYEDVNGVGGLVITNVNPHKPLETLEFKHAVYFDEKACNQLAFKLYFLGTEQEHFQQIYPTPEIQKRNTSSFDDIKIWEINTVGFENK